MNCPYPLAGWIASQHATSQKMIEVAWTRHLMPRTRSKASWFHVRPHTQILQECKSGQNLEWFTKPRNKALIPFAPNGIVWSILSSKYAPLAPGGSPLYESIMLSIQLLRNRREPGRALLLDRRSGRMGRTKKTLIIETVKKNSRSMDVFLCNFSGCKGWPSIHVDTQFYNSEKLVKGICTNCFEISNHISVTGTSARISVPYCLESRILDFCAGVWSVTFVSKASIRRLFSKVNLKWFIWNTLR